MIRVDYVNDLVAHCTFLEFQEMEGYVLLNDEGERILEVGDVDVALVRHADAESGICGLLLALTD
jgi:hypothetical protein